MVEALHRLQAEFDTELACAESMIDIEQITVTFLGRKGRINALFEECRARENGLREHGKALNELKSYISSKLDVARSTLVSSDRHTRETWVDTSAPGIRPRVGSLHPTTEVIRSINHFFRYYGYSVYEGPEIETSEFNFERLNLPVDHPARDLQDTLYIREPDWLLRTHTSSVEARALAKLKPPFRIVVPGKVYRNETANATNNSVFYQYQGVLVDKHVSLAHLRGTLASFIRFLYGDSARTRFRCKYYPEVEPGAGMDVQCTFCTGKGCSVCKYRGWIEVLGSGIVHPNILAASGIDTQVWSGFAFGLGLDRLVMLKYGIDDVRSLYSGSLVYEDRLI